MQMCRVSAGFLPHKPVHAPYCCATLGPLMGCWWWRACAACSSCVDFPFYFLFASHVIASGLWVNALLVGAKAQASSGPDDSGCVSSRLLLWAAWAPESCRGWVAADATVPCHSHSHQLSQCLWTYRSFGELKSWLQIEKAKENQPELWSSKRVLEETEKPGECQWTGPGLAAKHILSLPAEPLQRLPSFLNIFPGISLNRLTGTLTAMYKPFNREMS